MAKYDAFGREIGEDTLAALRGSGEEPRERPEEPRERSEEPRGRQAERAREAEPVRAEAAAVRLDRHRRRRRGPGGWLGMLVVGAAVVGAGLFAADAGRKVRDAVRELPGLSTPHAGPGGEAARARPPRGLQRGSLLVRRNLQAALRRLRAARLGRLTTLRLAPDRLDAQLLTRSGRLRSVQLDSTGRLRTFGASGPGFGATATLTFARVDAAAPARLARAAARRLHRPAIRVSYLVLLDFAGTPLWSVFFTDGAHFQGDAAGRIVRRVS